MIVSDSQTVKRVCRGGQDGSPGLWAVCDGGGEGEGGELYEGGGGVFEGGYGGVSVALLRGHGRRF